MLGKREVHAPVMQEFGKAREFVVVRALGAVDFDELVADEGAVLGIAALVARH